MAPIRYDGGKRHIHDPKQKAHIHDRKQRHAYTMKAKDTHTRSKAQKKAPHFQFLRLKSTASSAKKESTLEDPRLFASFVNPLLSFISGNAISPESFGTWLKQNIFRRIYQTEIGVLSWISAQVEGAHLDSISIEVSTILMNWESDYIAK